MCCLSTLPLSGAPLYRVGAPKPQDDFVHWEVSAEGVFSSAEVEDSDGNKALNGARGVGLRTTYALRPWLALGAEGLHFKKQTFGPFVKRYEAERVGILAKITLSPDTSPRAYAVLGAGKNFYSLTYGKTMASAHWKKTKKSASYVQLGLGLETDIWKAWFIGAEGDIFYGRKTGLGRYYQTGKTWEALGRLRTGIRF